MKLKVKGGDDMKNNLLMVAIVAIVASLLTANLTGNVIKVKKDPSGPSVYTKLEIDNKLSRLLTYDQILDNLQKNLHP